MRHEIFSWHRRQEIFSWGGTVRENVLSQEKISCLISFWVPPMRKSPVSCLMRKCHVSRENLMSYQFLVPPNKKISCLLSHEKTSYLKRKSPVSFLMRKCHVSRDILLGFMEKTWDMRISHETGDFLMRQETGDFLIGGAKTDKTCDLLLRY